jgi:hypothetical protein
MTPEEREKILEAMARAYDKEDAALRGEPDPWDNSPWEEDSPEEAEWREERKTCAGLALTAAYPLIREAVLREARTG